ncbi:hypothetical protein [Pleionea sediminis]|uniref:hypothetical protein n=1 Tax=Pleionea sediminis TaxID=2569479 RepID=UPI001186F17C|nr:hypothetical protein [Pleionea sediminis]
MSQSILRILFYLFLSLILITPFDSLEAHPGYYGTAFHAHSLEEAFNTAEQEKKLVFVYVGENERGWRHFRWPTDENSSLIDLLVRESVIVEKNINKDAEYLASFGIRKKGLYLMSENRKLLEAIPYDAVASKVEHILTQFVTSKEGFTRIEQAMASGSNPFFNRERKAAALALAGNLDESISLYDQCLEEAVNEDSLAAKSRRPHVIGALLNLSKKSDKAVTVLRKNRDLASNALAKNTGNSKLSSDIARIDFALDSEENAYELFKSLPKGSRAKHGMFDYVSGMLMKRGQYKELLELIEPIKAIEGEITLYHRNKVMAPASAEKGIKRGSRNFVIDRALMVIEALAGTGRTKESQQAKKILLDFDSSKETLSRLSDSLGRVSQRTIKNK